MRQIGLAFLAVISVFLIMVLILDPLINSIGLVKPADAADRFKFFLGKPFVFISYLVTIVWLGAALGEELLMRGFLLNTIATFFGNRKIAWLIALVVHAAIFGSLHNYQGLHGVISTGVVTLIFGFIYFLAKRSLFSTILAHVLINTISLTAYYVTGGVVN